MRELTAAELGIWLGHHKAPDPTIYNCAELLTFETPLDVARFEEALTNVLEAAEVLRTRYVEQAGVPRAEPLASVPRSHWAIAREQLPSKDGQGRRESHSSRVGASTLAELGEVFVRQPFDLAKGEVCRQVLFVTETGVHAWLHVAHHIALDGFAFQLVARTVAAEYTRLTAGRPREWRLNPVAAVAKHEKSYERSPAKTLDGEFFARTPWANFPAARLTAYEDVSATWRELPPARPLRQTCRTAPSTQGAVAELARAMEVSWPELLLAVAARFVAAKSKRKRFCLGVPVMLRLGTPKVNTPCMAMNIVRLPIALQLAEPLGDTLGETVRQVRSAWRAISPHQRFRYEELGGNKFGPVVNVLPFTSAPTFGGVASQSCNLAAGPVTDLSLMVATRNDGLEIIVDGHPECFTIGQLRQLAGDFAAHLARDVQWHHLSLGERVAQSGEAAPQVSPPSGARRSPPPNGKDVSELLAATARSRAGHVALIQGERRFTYEDLRLTVKRMATNLACRLDVGVGNGAHLTVALQLGRGIEAVLCALAVLELGACFAFLDPQGPPERRAALLRQLRPNLLVTTALGELPEEMDLCLCCNVTSLLAEPEAESVGRNLGSEPEDPAYVVFTSGSTGAPKGVVVSRGALLAFIESANLVYPLTEDDRVLQFAPLTFDACLEEIFCTLAMGATLVVREDDLLESMRHFSARCSAWGITVLDLPTAFWHEWVEYLDGASCQAPACLRVVLIGGEAADARRILAFRQRAPHVRLINTYGPSEATIVATWADLTECSLEPGVPIGRPLPNVGTLVIDEQGSLVSDGEGELYLSGQQLATGYLGQPAETQARFVASSGGNVRVYRTGDRVKQMATGELHFVGRVDHEVKLSGYRISPAEVENALGSHARVAASVVTAPNLGGHIVLTAHVQLSPVESADHAASEDDLRAFLLEKMPAPMVPTRYVFHTRLPINASGKVDRRSLLATDEAESPSTAEVGDAEFLDDAGRRLLTTWREVLGRAAAGPDEDFFRLGGHSLQVIQLAARLHSSHPETTASLIFKNPTPRRLLRALGAPAEKPLDLLTSPSLDLPKIHARQPPDHRLANSASVLVTGATGFVGSWIVHELLLRGVKVTCVVRGQDEHSARARLLSAPGPLAETRGADELLHVVPWDLAEANVDLAALLRRFGVHSAVIHCAANVTLTRTLESLAPANVDATRVLLQYAHATSARFCFVSTLAVAPAFGASVEVPEQFFPAHPGLRDGYQQSKWQAEHLCQQASSLGMDVLVVRLGRVTGSCSSPTVNSSDIVWRIARAAVRCGAWPGFDFAEVWTPVDEVARVISDLTLEASERASVPLQPVFHVAHQGTVHLRRLRERLVESGYALDVVDTSTWVERARASADAEDSATLAFFELRSADPAPVTSKFSCANLFHHLPHLDVTPMGDDLLDRYITAGRALGFLP